MKEIEGNIFDFVMDDSVDAICITTNGIVNNNGLAMMGAGTAGEAAKRWPSVRKNLGRSIQAFGNLPYVIGLIDDEGNFHDPKFELLRNKEYKCLVWSFPTKNDFRDKSDIELIKRSATLLMEHADKFELKKIYIPAPGIGVNTGKLDWETEVRPAIQNILDDRFYIVFLEGK